MGAVFMSALAVLPAVTWRVVGPGLGCVAIFTASAVGSLEGCAVGAVGPRRVRRRYGRARSSATCAVGCEDARSRPHFDAVARTSRVVGSLDTVGSKGPAGRRRARRGGAGGGPARPRHPHGVHGTAALLRGPCRARQVRPRPGSDASALGSALGAARNLVGSSRASRTTSASASRARRRRVGWDGRQDPYEFGAWLG